MFTFKQLAVTTLLCAAVLLATGAQAHPALLSSTPAEGSVVKAAPSIELHFSEKLTTQFSGAKLLMTAMPGMSHPPMAIKASVAGGADPKTMLITPAAPLVPGTYKVEWRAVSADTHPITGAVTFSVN